jgi:hypothetical protein
VQGLPTKVHRHSAGRKLSAIMEPECELSVHGRSILDSLLNQWDQSRISGSQGGDYEGDRLLEYCAMQSCRNVPTFQMLNTSTIRVTT